jgi:clan AA aspartic protease (TIGR02281 family)
MVRKMCIKCSLIFFAFILFPYLYSWADTLYLKDGRKVEGLIKKEDEEMVELEVCIGGIIGYKQSEIEKIERSTSLEAEKLRQGWEKEKSEGERKEEKRKIEEEKSPKSAEFSIAGEGILVDAELNNLVNVSLMLDTGASLLILKRSIADRLGINLHNLRQEVKLRVADGREVNAKFVILKSVRVKDILAKEVETAIMLDNVEGAKFQDGLLGMSFLKRFNFKVDHKKNKLIIEKPAEEK